MHLISPDERPSVAWLFIYAFGNAAAYVLARTIADSTFLSRVGPDHLPAMYMLSAGVVALSSLIYGHLVRQFRLRTMVLMTLLLLAVASMAMPALMGRFGNSLTVFAVVYLVAQVRGSLGTIQFASLLNDQFGERGPERVVGLIGLGATLAGITLGITLGQVVDGVSVGSLMYLAGAIDLVTMLPILCLRRPIPLIAAVEPPDAPAATAQPDTVSKFRLRDAVRSPYVLSIACVVTISVLASTLVEYQWKVTAASELNRNEEDLARYFGYFYGTVYLLTGLLQLSLTSRVLSTRGFLAGQMAFPIALLATTCLSWLASAERLLLWPLTLTKGCDTLKRSFSDPSIQVVYGPLESGLRNQAITFVAGIAKPLAEALAAVSLLVMTRWVPARELSLVIIGLILLWIGFNIRVWKQFRSLRSPAE